MIKVNEYLEGKVKSLGFESEGARFTAGVFMPGEYTFDTEQEEHVTVTVGRLEIRLLGKNWKTVKAGETVVIPPKSKFNLKVAHTGSYVCKYV
jgi:uncharacterized protein YaiE (UPF0345 family)